jgi:hypothetical protein
MMISEKDIADAIDRIARSDDGELLYRYLQKIVMWIPDLSADEGALRQDQGRRRFALDLMGLMAKGIDERSGSTGGTARPVIFARRESGGGAGRHVSARDFIRVNDPELTRLRVNTAGASGES